MTQPTPEEIVRATLEESGMPWMSSQPADIVAALRARGIIAPAFPHVEPSEPTGPAYIAQMPPSVETARRWWSMYCDTCGVEEMMAETADNPRLLARVREHNITRHSSSTIHQALSDAFLDADTILPDGGDPRGQANLLADIALRLIRPLPVVEMNGTPVKPERMEYRLTFHDDCSGESVTITTDRGYAEYVGRKLNTSVEQRRHGSTDRWEPMP